MRALTLYAIILIGLWIARSTQILPWPVLLFAFYTIILPLGGAVVAWRISKRKHYQARRTRIFQRLDRIADHTVNEAPRYVSQQPQSRQAPELEDLQ
jgi:hypothetical protein